MKTLLNKLTEWKETKDKLNDIDLNIVNYAEEQYDLEFRIYEYSVGIDGKYWVGSASEYNNYSSINKVCSSTMQMPDTFEEFEIMKAESDAEKIKIKTLLKEIALNQWNNSIDQEDENETE